MSDRAKWIVIGVTGLLLAVIVTAVVLSGDDSDSPASVKVKQGNLNPPEQVLAGGEAASVVMDTSEGSFTIELDTVASPNTTNAFAYLTQEGFYDGLSFHRIVPDFVIQGGDPKGDGTGGPGFKTVEQPAADLKYEPGVVAMAKSGGEAPGTSGSQFFVVTGTGGASLPPEYALVGRVIEGLDVVEKIGRLGGPDEQPTKVVVIEKASLERA
ncbi:MAG: peptidylprolyl isomerase [Solirubrobacterales bacterium]